MFSSKRYKAVFALLTEVAPPPGVMTFFPDFEQLIIEAESFDELVSLCGQAGPEQIRSIIYYMDWKEKRKSTPAERDHLIQLALEKAEGQLAP